MSVVVWLGLLVSYHSRCWLLSSEGLTGADQLFILAQ